MVKLETYIFITQFSEMWSEVRKISKNFKIGSSDLLRQETSRNSFIMIDFSVNYTQEVPESSK